MIMKLLSPAHSVQPAAEPAPPPAETLFESIGIPARPGALVDLQNEIAGDDPDIRRIANLVASDVALTIAALRIVNSPAFALSRRCETVAQAISMLGLQQLNVIVTGLTLRNLMRGDARQLQDFWDTSSKRAYALSLLARDLGWVEVSVAQSFGLFCDIGILLLLQRFANYGQTLIACRTEVARCFTGPEQDRHDTDHAQIGALMARSWGLPPTVCMAVGLHHDYTVFADPKVPETVTRLIAMNLLAEVAIQRFAGQSGSIEWDKGGDHASGALVLNAQDAEDWIDRLFHDFAEGLG